MKKNTQMAKIKKHFIEHKRLTPHEAIKKFNCTRLAAVVCHLKRKHWDINNIAPKGELAIYVYSEN